MSVSAQTVERARAALGDETVDKLLAEMVAQRSNAVVASLALAEVGADGTAEEKAALWRHRAELMIQGHDAAAAQLTTAYTGIALAWQHQAELEFWKRCRAEDLAALGGEQAAALAELRRDRD